MALLGLLSLVACRDWDQALADRRDAGFGATGGGTATGGGSATGGGTGTGGGGGAYLTDAGTLTERSRFTDGWTCVRLVGFEDGGMVGACQTLDINNAGIDIVHGGASLSAFAIGMLSFAPLDLNGVTATSPTDVFITGRQALVRVTNGSNYEESSCGWASDDWRGQSTASASESWFVGIGGITCQWLDGGFNKVDLSTMGVPMQSLYTVKAFPNGDRFFGGVMSELVVWPSGGTPTVMTDPNLGQLIDAFLQGPSSDDVWAGASGGAVAHWDGQSWSAMPSLSGSSIVHEIAVPSKGDVWAVNDTNLFHFNGTDWDVVPVPNHLADDVFHTVVSAGPGRLFLGGYTDAGMSGDLTAGFIQVLDRH